MSDREQEDGLAANREDVDRYRVYADWLEDRADPRAAVVRTAIEAREAPPRSRKQARVAREARDAYMATFHPDLVLASQASMSWHLGFVHELSLRGLSGEALARAIDFLRAPICRLLWKLDATGVSPLDLAEVSVATHLEWLTLNMTKVEDLTPLRRLAALRSLELASCPVRDLEPLADLPLQHLHLMGTKVTNISPLESVTTLNSLVLMNTSIDDAAIASLKKAVPALKKRGAILR